MKRKQRGGISVKEWNRKQEDQEKQEAAWIGKQEKEEDQEAKEIARWCKQGSVDGETAKAGEAGGKRGQRECGFMSKSVCIGY